MKQKPMNLLFIFSDQHSKEKTGCYGNDIIQTPNIDKLSNNGTRFDNAYTNCPICVPARASLATGRYVHELKLWDNASPYKGQYPSYGHRLSQNNIQVTTIGKLHFRNTEDDTGFPDQRVPLHIRNGIGDLYGSIRERDALKPGLGKSILEAKSGESMYTDFDMEVAKEACSYLENEAVKMETPWMLQLGFVLPHFPFIAPEKYWNLYNEDEIPLPKNAIKGERPEYQFCKDLRRYMGLENGISNDAAKKAVHAYYAMCSFVDDQIGRVLNTLENCGLLDNTRIIYSTDHGEMLGDHGLWYKNCLFEGAASIPLIMSGPDIKKAAPVSENVSLVDLYPTILDCFDVELNAGEKELPGESLLPLAQGKDTVEKSRAILSEFHASGSFTAGYMIRKGAHKLIYYVGYEPQLFNLEIDKDELQDLSKNVEYADVLEELLSDLKSIVDPEKTNLEAKNDQTELLNTHGGRKHIKETFNPVIYSPVDK